MKHFLIFGTHPFLSLAEAKAVIGGSRPIVAGAMAVFDVESWDGKALNERLGGTVKLGEVMAEIPFARLDAQGLADQVEKRLHGKKMEFGLTAYGGSVKSRTRTKNFAIALKREFQQRGYQVRWVTGERGDLTPAAVAKAHLIDRGIDLVIGLTEKTAVVGRTTHVQDADAWSARDYGRPFRDEITGMLPPKLARMMVNMVIRDKEQGTGLLDPFCGGGTVLMEAALVGASSMIGSDIDPRQIEGTNQNLDWLTRQSILTGEQRMAIKTFVSAAEHFPLTRGEWSKVERVTIVTEGYLGRPLTGHETLATLRQQKEEVEAIWRKALPSLAKIQQSGDRVVCVWPVFVSSHGTVAVDIKKDVERLGYRMVDPLSGWMEKPVTLTYARPDQRIKRNIVVMEREGRF